MKRLYGIAGDGRASRHLQRYLRLLGIPYRLWHRRLGIPPGEALAPCGTVFLLLNDSAIPPFLAAHPFLRDRRLIHFSGSLRLPGVTAMHPFMPLASRPLTLPQYKAIPFALEPGQSLRRLVPELPNPAFRVSPRQKRRYHALCALGANLPVLLWRKASAGLAAYGVSAEEAASYFQASLDNFRRDPEGALSGPIARGDAATVSSDIAALGRDPYAEVYEAFARAHAPAGSCRKTRSSTPRTRSAFGLGSVQASPSRGFCRHKPGTRAVTTRMKA